MSKRHQASRRRSYGRRQHQIHERADSNVGGLGLPEESTSAERDPRWGAGPTAAEAGELWPQPQGV